MKDINKMIDSKDVRVRKDKGVYGEIRKFIERVK